jgi:hypothetical protein
MRRLVDAARPIGGRCRLIELHLFRALCHHFLDRMRHKMMQDIEHWPLAARHEFILWFYD